MNATHPYERFDSLCLEFGAKEIVRFDMPPACAGGRFRAHGLCVNRRGEFFIIDDSYPRKATVRRALQFYLDAIMESDGSVGRTDALLRSVLAELPEP